VHVCVCVEREREREREERRERTRASASRASATESSRTARGGEGAMYFKLRSGWKAGASLAYRHPRHHRHHRHHRHDKSSEVSVLEHPLCKGTLSNHFFLRIRARAASLVSLYRCAPLRTWRQAHQGVRIRALWCASHAPCLRSQASWSHSAHARTHTNTNCKSLSLFLID